MTRETVTSGGKSIDYSEKLDGNLFSRYKQLALDNHVWLSLGCFPEHDFDSGMHYLTHSIINEEGNMAAKYRKMHMFDVDLGS